MNKHVLIITSDAGFGHRKAAEAVESALTHLYGDACTITTNNPLQDPSIPGLIKALETQYDEVVTDDPTLYQIAYAATDAPLVSRLMQNVTSRVLNDTLTDLVRDKQPDAIVVTYPAFTEAALKAARNAQRKIPVYVVITDLIGVHSLWFHTGVDITFVPTGNVYKQAIDAGLDKTKIHLSGLPVNPKIALDDRPREAIRESLGWNVSQTTALIVGSARTRQTGGIARLLDRSGLEIQIAAVSGGDEQIMAELDRTEWQGNVHTYGFVTNLNDMQRAADFIICKAGGLIVTESLASGLPMILFNALPGQEVGNVKYVTEAGVGAWSPGPIATVATVISWLSGSGEELKNRRAKAKQIGKPRAALEVAERIMRQINHK